MKIDKKNSTFEIAFTSTETVEEIMLAATFFLKKFLTRNKKVKFSIPERIYADLEEQKFKEIFSDQILEFKESERNLIELEVLKANDLNVKKRIEVFKIKIL